MPPICDEVQMCLYDEITWSRLVVLFTQTEKWGTRYNAEIQVSLDLGWRGFDRVL